MKSRNQIIGELIAYDKYQFVDGKLIAAIANDTYNTLIDSIEDDGQVIKQEVI